MTTYFEKTTEKKAIEINELLDYLDEQVDFADEESIKSAAPMAQRVAIDPSWFINIVNEEIKNNLLSDSEFKNVYTSNSTLLGRSKKGKPYFLRANVWLPETDPLRVGMDRRFFAEDFFHDHSFDLLTVGLLGSGYKTNIRHYNHAKTIGHVDEIVDTYNNLHLQLEAGSALFMRKHETIHQQLPPEETSVSFNIMLDNLTTPRSRQYEFDIESKEKMRIRSVHYNGYRFSHSVEYLITMAATFKDENTLDYLFDLYKRMIKNSTLNEPTIILLYKWLLKMGINADQIPLPQNTMNSCMLHHFSLLELQEAKCRGTA